ncbi:MAG: acetyl/propionyl/methylcrotonyl-CoA carboxylase subunit alpha [Desulfosalsimonas sp.]|uniref:acetyl/propionyl/methylcrotonyl-CoA carboxylase subunit alpha n=1 Tax=Desulfosalsimonas sp. TaxID=3073848 RepID=UPI0039705400
MIHKILIANRGEIAVRIMRTCRNLGFRTVAVYSEADADALHVDAADEAVCIGGAPAAQSYLSIDNILDAAKKSQANAVHPGYGFLAENPAFVRACEAAGLVFIGPGADAMELMGSKRLSKEAMVAAGVPCIPGYHGKDQTDEVLLSEAEKISVPLMVKASAGGGGRGMRLITQTEDLAPGIQAARAEAKSTFGNDELILEKAIVEPRHIEIQVFADVHGNVIHLGERDCSVQRRHQKVVEEAPSPFVDADLREKMGGAAVNAARACNYLGAGTVEFMVDADKNFYFLEMNTRLQVEHPVTEMITGQDLVAWQIRVACGEKLPLSQDQIKFLGHAIEVRLYAEDARRGFLPQTGPVLAWQVPEREGVRVDSGIEAGREVAAHYDPIVAKVIAWGENRDEARRRLALVLRDAVLLGFNNNKLFLARIVNHPVFAKGEATTAFIEKHFSNDISMEKNALSDKTLALAAMIFYQGRCPQTRDAGWHTPAPYRYNFVLNCDETDYSLSLAKKDARFEVSMAAKDAVDAKSAEPEDDRQVTLEWVRADDHSVIYIHGGVRRKAGYAFCDNQLFVDAGSGHFVFEDKTLHTAKSAQDAAGGGDVVSAMNGVIVEVRVSPGQRVEAGQTLLVIESMKMQHQFAAAISGTVESVAAAAGDQVKPGQLLVTVAAEQEKGEAS